MDRDKLNILFVFILILVFDRVEFLYEGISNSDKMIGFLYSAEPIRADSYVYFASTRIQYVILSVILMTLLPKYRSETKAYLGACILYFIEFFLSYNEPYMRILLIKDFLLFGDLYLPISISTLKLFVIFGIIVSATNKLIKSQNHEAQ